MSLTPTDIVICTPLRTPVGRYGGVFVDTPVQDLAGAVVTAIVEKAGISADDIDDLILGQASPNGAAPALGRIVALDSGLGESVPGMQLDRRCGSGLQAIATAAAHVASGAADLIIAGGAVDVCVPEDLSARAHSPLVGGGTTGVVVVGVGHAGSLGVVVRVRNGPKHRIHHIACVTCVVCR